MTEKLRDSPQNCLPRCDSECRLHVDSAQALSKGQSAVFQCYRPANVTHSSNKNVVYVCQIPVAESTKKLDYF